MVSPAQHKKIIVEEPIEPSSNVRDPARLLSLSTPRQMSPQPKLRLRQQAMPGGYDTVRLDLLSRPIIQGDGNDDMPARVRPTDTVRPADPRQQVKGTTEIPPMDSRIPLAYSKETVAEPEPEPKLKPEPEPAPSRPAVTAQQRRDSQAMDSDGEDDE